MLYLCKCNWSCLLQKHSNFRYFLFSSTGCKYHTGYPGADSAITRPLDHSSSWDSQSIISTSSSTNTPRCIFVIKLLQFGHLLDVSLRCWFGLLHKPSSKNIFSDFKSSLLFNAPQLCISWSTSYIYSIRKNVTKFVFHLLQATNTIQTLILKNSEVL